MPKPKSTDFITLRGRTQYAKIFGDPLDNFDGDGKEWKLDFIVDDDRDMDRLKKLGILGRVKQKEDYLDGAPHMTLRQRTSKEKVRDEFGDMVEQWANPIYVVDVQGKAWDRTKLIGNGSVVDIKLRVADYGKGMQKGVYINGIRILDHVPYARPLFDELDEDDPYNLKANDKAKKQESNADPEDLDEDIPF